VNREACKFFSGSFAALAYAHAVYAVATSTGAINEPCFLGRRWGVGYMWAEAVAYSAASLALGYVGWKTKRPQQLEESTSSATNGQHGQRADAGEELHPVSG